MDLHRILFAGLGLACLALTGCASYQPLSYSSAADNAAAAKAAVPAGSQVSVPAATSGPGVKKNSKGDEGIMCRGAGPIGPANEQSFEAYVHDALVDELKLAGVYTDKGGKPIQINLTKIDFSSGLTDAQWNIVADVSVGTQPAFTVTEAYPFSSSFLGGVACQDTADAFMPAVQGLIKKILASDQLKADLAKP